MTTQIGGLGVWSFIDNLSAAKAAAFAQRLEGWGYSALWVPEAVGRDPFAIIAWLAAHTRTLVLATGIANIYARDPMTMNSIRKTLAEMAPGRFVMGLGVSHAHLVHKVRGHDYSAKPVATMRAYLEGMEKALYLGPQPAMEAPIVLAALRHNMLQLAAEKTRGAHSYFVPPEHTARDFSAGGSDRLVDAIVAWGDETVIRERIEAHRAAGANHVCIQPFRPDGEMGADLEVLELLAPVAG